MKETWKGTDGGRAEEEVGEENKYEMEEKETRRRRF